MPDQTGKYAIVTGASPGGIGFETALQLARKGATVILGMRSQKKASEAVDQILTAVPEAKGRVVPLELDLCSLASVRSFAEQFNKQFGTLHMLINNAGIMATPRSVTKDGFESQIGTNHLGHFALTSLLLDALKKGGKPGSPARVVSVSSPAAFGLYLNLNDLHGEKSYKPWRAYIQSKLADLLFIKELNRRLPKDANVIAIASHPGAVATNLYQTSGGGNFVKIIGQKTIDGAMPLLLAATSPTAKPGGFYGPRYLFWGAPVNTPYPPFVTTKENCRKLWQLSVEMTKTNFGGI